MPSPKSAIKLEFEAIGTQWSIDLVGPADQAGVLSRVLADRIDQFDRDYSRFRPDSWVTKIKTPGIYKVPSDFDKLYKFYERLNKLTDGAVTPLIGDALERAGYDASYSLKPGKMIPIPDLAKALDYSSNTLHVKYSLILDFGAAGKGYLVDLLANQLLQRGIDDFTVNAGGDIRHHSPAPANFTPVGLENPDDPDAAIGIVKLNNKSLCGSAINRRKWADWHHIIHPRTLKPVDDIKAIWVVADDCLQADGLATALFFAEPSAFAADFNFEYLIMKADNSIRVSDNFPGKLFYETDRSAHK